MGWASHLASFRHGCAATTAAPGAGNRLRDKWDVSPGGGMPQGMERPCASLPGHGHTHTHTHALIVISGQKCATRWCHARSAAGVPPPALRHWSVFRNRPYPRSCPACARSPQPVPLQQTAANVAQWPARWLGEPSVAGPPPTPRGRSRSCPLTPPCVRRAGATSPLVATSRARVPPVHRANGGNM